MTTHSCIYEGTIVHSRREPAKAFSHRIALTYLDLDEVPALLGGRLIRRTPGFLRFRRRDYHGPPEMPLDEAVRRTVERHTGERPAGSIRVLTNLRSFGHCFNPVSFYYCLGHDERLHAILAEVTNTPWGERHAYVIRGSSGHFDKALHVSPFMGMDHNYEVTASTPGPSLDVAIESHHGIETAFAAKLALTRHELTDASARRLELRYPVVGLRTLVMIYGHAIGLKLAGAPLFSHPGRAGS